MALCWSKRRRRIIIAKKKSTFVCRECGYNSPKYLGRCPNCSSWSSFEEEVETVNEFELLEIPAGSEHVITCLQDAQVFVVKL